MFIYFVSTFFTSFCFAQITENKITASTESQINSIRKNFTRINSIKTFTNIDTLDVWQSTEGGVGLFFYKDTTLEKVLVKRFGETFQKLSEYYLLKNELSFVFEKTLRYNRPIYYDSIMQAEFNDTEAFDISKSTVIEERSYFANQQLIRKLNSKEVSKSYETSFYATERERLLKEFQELLERIPKKEE